MKRVLIIAGILLPFLAISQVNVHKTDSVSISTIIPFFEFAQLQNVPQANFSIQIPVAKRFKNSIGSLDILYLI